MRSFWSVVVSAVLVLFLSSSAVLPSCLGFEDIPRCDITRPYMDNLCELNIPIGSKFQIDCGAHTAISPTKFTDADPAMCIRKVEDPTRDCSDVDTLKKYVEVKKTGTTLHAEFKSRGQMERPVFLHLACKKTAGGDKTMMVSLNLYPILTQPSYITSTCDENNRDGTPATCLAQGGRTGVLTLKNLKANGTGFIPADATSRDGKVCKGIVSSGTTCPNGEVKWLDLFADDNPPTFQPLEATENGVNLQFKYGSKETLRSGTIINTKTPGDKSSPYYMQFYLTPFVFKPEDESNICYSGKCHSEMKQLGQRFVVNCTGADKASVDPPDFLEDGQLCATEYDGSKKCPKKKDFTGLLRIGVDPVHKSFVLFACIATPEYDTVGYAVCGDDKTGVRAKITVKGEKGKKPDDAGKDDDKDKKSSTERIATSKLSVVMILTFSAIAFIF